MSRTAVLAPSPSTPTAAAPVAPCRADGTQELLAALVTYQETVHRGVAERLGVRVEGVEVLAEVVDEHQVRFDVRLTGPEEPAAYDRVRAVVEAHAPVLDLVAG